MYLSKNFVKTQKENPSYEESVNAKLLIRAGFINQLMAWVYTYLPFGIRVLRKIENIIREEMENIGGQEIFMPSLQPKSNWQQTDRWDNYDTLFRFNSYYTNNDYVIWPTHEEIVTPLMKNFVFSYKDLPTYVFQIQNKFRDEKRAKSGILRGREFGMKDLYSFHTSKEDLDDYYEKAISAYKNIYKRVWIWDKTYLTYARGGTFSKYSHEFQTIASAWEDKIHICFKCNLAINEELIDEQNICPSCWNSELKKEKAIEVWNIFKLWTWFSNPFGFSYKDKEGQEKPVIMWCYWIGTGRLMGSIVEICYDENWIIWPENIAPYKYAIIPIWENWFSKSKEIYEFLKEKWQEVVLDDRDCSPWFKFKDADLIGYPYQIIVSDKTLEKWENIVEFKKRANGEKSFIDYKSL